MICSGIHIHCRSYKKRPFSGMYGIDAFNLSAREQLPQDYTELLAHGRLAVPGASAGRSTVGADTA